MCRAVYTGAGDRCAEYDPRRFCPDCMLGPAPVWSNRDGATPDGIVNLLGNVREWVFDWYDRGYAGLSRTDPVGRGCDLDEPTRTRVTRGGSYDTPSDGLHPTRRDEHYTATRAPFVGFRCARTLTDDDTLCGAAMPAVRDVCLPGADVRVPRGGRRPDGACPAPDLSGEDEGDLTGCAAGREQTTTCAAGLADFCAAPAAVGCHAYLVRRFTLDPQVITDFISDEELELAGVTAEDLGSNADMGVLNAMLDGMLAPAGGDTLIVIDAPQRFGQLGAHAVRISNGLLDGEGALHWLGVLEDWECVATDPGDFSIQTRGGDLQFEEQCAVDTGVLYAIETPLRIRYSAASLGGAGVPAGLRGSLLLFVSEADAAASRLGSTTSDGYEMLSSWERLDLCAPAFASGCTREFLPGCVLDNFQLACEDPGGAEQPSTCLGWMFPVSFDAVPAWEAGIPDLAPCEEGD